MDNSAMTSFYDSHTLADHSGLYQANLGSGENSTSQLLNIYSSRGKLLEMAATGSSTNNPSSLSQSNNIHKSPISNSKEVEKALDQMFRGFSFYSEPVEEQEVQRQIREYLKMKNSLKRGKANL